jgi:diguanylate cyclase (GGDEF)-like protein/PAS domain S-box-containing protein
MFSAFAVGVALLIAVGIGTAFETVTHENTVQSVDRTYEILNGFSELARYSAEADARKASPAQAHAALRDARRALERIQNLNASLNGNDPRERARVTAIELLIGEQDSALAFATPSTGDAASTIAERIRIVIAGIEADERVLLDGEIKAQRRTAVVSYWLLGLRAFFALPLILLAARWVSREFRMRTAAERVLAGREEQYRQVIELAGDMIYRVDTEGRFTFCNQAMLTGLHLTSGEVVGRSYLKLVRPDRRRAAQRFYLRQALRKLKSTYGEFPFVDGHGRERWIGQNVQLILHEGEITGFQGIAREITERKHAEQELEKSRNFIARIASTTPGILYVFDLDELRVVYNNHEMTGVLGNSAEEEARHFSDRSVHPDDESIVRSHHASMRLAPDGEVRRFEFRARHADGHWMWLSARETPFERAANGLVKRVVGIAQDATERKTAQETLTRQANSDALTGLSNRYHFRTSLESALRRASRDRTPIALCLFDLDEFKAVNDHFGHAAGDEVLEEVGNIIRAELRSQDLAGRLGGDEFCFALPGTDENEGARVAERIRHRLSTLAFGLSSSAPFSVTATFGVAGGDGALEAKELLEAADRALYRAKAAGRNRVCVDA